MDSPTLMINEVFHSIQGESTWAGRPCVFVRLTGCHLRCDYCDTAYAFHEGSRRTVADVIDEVESIGRGCRLVQVTGGEPLLQGDVHALMAQLCNRGCTVLVETSGSCDIRNCDPRVIRIMDLKTPGSGECERILWPNLDHLTERDEVKFVLADRADYEWSRDVIQRHGLTERTGAVLLSAVHQTPAGAELPGSTGLELQEVADWALADGLNVVLQAQLHKLIWGPTVRGV